MSSKMPFSRAKTLQVAALTLFIIALTIIIYTDQSIRSQVSEKSFLTPTQYFSSPKKFYLGQVYSIQSFKDHFREHHYRQREFGQPIAHGDYAIGNADQCESVVSTQNQSTHRCVTFRPRLNKQLYFISLNEWDQVQAIYFSENLEPTSVAEGEAKVFAQYLGDAPTLQSKAQLGEIPRYCLEAVLAIEDPDFLEHRGVSIKGTLRAVLANLLSGWGSQGGSTITQQLVKNYFLTPKKTISRKIKEILISLIFEFRVSKDDILETYLNIIYLGQSGVFEVRGYKAASEHYFQKPLAALELGDCALLAAIVNSPGRYNPISHPEKAKKRRQRVLDKMQEHQMISKEEYDEALLSPLPKKIKPQLAASAPYYVDAVKKNLKELGFDNLSGLKIYTALEPFAQKQAEVAIRKGIQYFEANHPFVKKVKTEQKENLQAALIGTNPMTGGVSAIVGGRNFASSPFNRAIESQRQVGSVIKPLVYLTAIENRDDNGEPYTPITRIENSPFRYEYEKQVWEPKNYDKSFSAPVPLFFALKESMNVPTARLGIAVGLDKIIDNARKLGVESPLKAFPSLSLGAFELRPMEVAQAYTTISQLGKKQTLHILKAVFNQKEELLYTHQSKTEQVGDPQNYSVLVGMMKETLISGTGRYTRKMGFHHIAAGKTGTTSDTRDAWFAGFTPFHTAVVWVGYDNAKSHRLTGASGALPIWTNYMREISKQYANIEFPFPENVHKETFTPAQLSDLGVPEKKQKNTELVLKNQN